jgi:hypothetical protein
MIIQRQKKFAYAGGLAKKIVTDDAIRKGLSKEVAVSTKWIKEHPLDPGVFKKKTVKKTSWFAKKED